MQCYGCLKTISIGMYCPKCKKELFDGRNVKPLTFDKTEFYEKQNELAKVMSISGVQDKISLRFDSGNELVPTADNGHYILKPVPSRLLQHKEEIVPNEHVSMQISRQIFGIPTAVNGLIPFSDGELAYITRRFDYARENNRKLDQEDFASILNKTEENSGETYKYDSSYEAIASAIKKYAPAYRLLLEDFFSRIILNYLIGNGDAHLKNFSLYRPENRSDLTLTPNYDLLFTSYHINETIGDMGLDLFDDLETRSYGALGYYTLEDFELFAKMLEIPDKRLKKLFQKIHSLTTDVEDLVSRSYMHPEGKEAFMDKYHDRLNKRLFYVIGKEYSYKSVILS
ncbi:MAG: HipA domain-containing protein [Campylobacterota bacterium]|nr:HipA domain-containing protein [Campylobacterota bacterium]